MLCNTIVQPNFNVFSEKGAKIICLEKIRDHVQYERAIMAVRFNKYFVGTQFHPEADPLSFIANLKKAEAREKIINMTRYSASRERERETFGGRGCVCGYL